MSNPSITQNEEFKYSKMLSSLFCSVSIIALSILCLLNNLSLDIYSAIVLLKVVLPAAFCFWFLGFSIGKILDGLNREIVKEHIKQEREAYEIPSMFASSNSENVMEDDFGIL